MSERIETELSEGLQWVSDELNNSLKEARRALESFVESDVNVDALKSCAELLHTVHGALRMVEVYGAALLAEEMVVVSNALSERRIANQQEGLEALSRAMVQLPSYLDRVMGGGRDMPLILLPLLNDLRAVRGSPLLSESSLFILNVNRVSTPPARTAPRSDEDIRILARELRPHFQSALLNWLRGKDPDMRLAALADIAQKIEDAAATTTVFQVWWVIGGIVEALRDGGLRGSASVKRLLGQGDRQLKELVVNGEALLGDEPPTNLLNNLLYYVGRATSDGAKVQSIKTSFSLAEMLEPVGDQDSGETLLNAPSVNLMRTVGAAIRQDIGEIKDAIDLFVRSGDSERGTLAGQRDSMRKIADTLSVLGLDELRQQIATESRRLQAFVDGHADTDSTLMQIASVLIEVEGALDQQLMAQVLPVDESNQRSAAEVAESSDRRAVVEAVLRECIVNFTRIKDALAQYVNKPDSAAALDPVPDLFKGIRAGLLMLEKTRAVELVEMIAWHIGEYRDKGEEHLTDYELDRLADSIVSVEYYMDTVQKGRSEPGYMLDNAAASLSAVRRQPPTPADAETPIDSAPAAATAPPPPVEAALPDVAEPVAADAHLHIDPELLELFIEEAREEISILKRNLPRWRNEPGNRELLLGIRRAFHTLKGSGRMVGANLIGEFSWALEKILNGVIDQDVTDENVLGDVLAEGVRALPELVEQLESGTAPATDVKSIVLRAEALLAGDIATATGVHDSVAGPRPAEHAGPVGDAAVVPASSRLDPVLYDIFYNETGGHLASISEYVAEARATHAPHRVDDRLHRAWHTLCGSANMAAVSEVVEIAAPMNDYLRDVMKADAALDTHALDVMSAACTAVETVVARINSDEPPPHTTALRADIAGLHSALALTAAAEPAEDERQEVAGTRAAAAATDPSFDPEIAAVFADEAAELLEASDAALAGLLEDGDTDIHSGALLRHLHTLKGGARMAGVAGMGDLSHELETLIESVSGREQALTGACREALRHGFDRLHAMQEALAAHQLPPAGVRARAEIHALTAGPVAEAPAADDAVVAEPVADAPAAQAPVFEDPVAVEPIAEEEVGAQSAADEAIAATPPVEQPLQDAPAAEKPVTEAAAAEAAAAEAAAAEAAAAEAAAAEAAAAEAAAAEAAAPGPVGPAPVAAGPPVVAPTAAMHADADADVDREAAAFADMTAAAAAGARTAASQRRPDYARVDARMLDEMLNNAGEVSIFHSRLEQEVGAIGFNLAELSQTVSRLRDQLRKLDAETEAQIRYRHQDESSRGDDFDPLELDRYSTIQQLSRALAESVSDLVSIQDLLGELSRESEGLLTQQARVTTELQDALIRTRMLPFSNFIPRLERVTRRTARDTGKQVRVDFIGGEGELDRQVLQRMQGPFEHMLRNAVIHGIESPGTRREKGKAETGVISVTLQREGAEMVVRISDDGAGLDVDTIKAVASERGLIDHTSTLVGKDALNLIMTPGFSTAPELTHAAGRGVGMDVVANEVKQLGGALSVDSEPGRGTTFTVRLPLTLAVTQSLLVRCGSECFAIPLPAVEGIVRVSIADVKAHLNDPDKRYVYDQQEYRFDHLGHYLGAPPARLDEADGQAIPLVLVRAGEHSTALIADEMLGSREVVVKTAGPLLAGIPGVAGATILGDGSIVMILDVGALVRRKRRVPETAFAPTDSVDERPLIMVVDDSITVRRVTQRLLERNDMRVVTAKDGVDAVAMMEEQLPDLVLLDIEMPRMDGYEVSTHIRNSVHLQHLPIIMVTSRTGDKHRARAFELGVDGYLGKPYQENQLLDAMRPLLTLDDRASRAK